MSILEWIGAFVWVIMRTAGAVGPSIEAFRSFSELLSLLPGPVGVGVRRGFYRRALTRCGDNVTVGFGTVFAHPSAEIDNDVYIGRYCLLGDTRIGAATLVSDYVRIVTGQHEMGSHRDVRSQPEVYKTVTVGRDCWLGNGSVVMADMADGAVAAAGAIVTRAVPALVIVGGVPANPIGRRPSR